MRETNSRLDVLEKKERDLARTLKNRFVAGRLRTDRTAPSAYTDVVGGDELGDIVRTGAYEYLLVNDSGTLKWARHALDVAW